MKESFLTGFSFGLTSATITTLGLIIGLNSGTHSKLVVIGGILTIAVADAFSDALGIHIAKETENRHSAKEVWQATFYTFLTKFCFALTFSIPVFLLDSLSIAINIDIAWGFLLLGLFSYYIAKSKKVPAAPVIFEHLIIMAVVIFLTHSLGHFIDANFGVTE